MVVCQHHLEHFRDPDHNEGGRMFDPEVDRAAGQVVSGLNLRSLEELEKKTHAMLRSGQPVDGEFWDLVLKKIHVEKAIVSQQESSRSRGSSAVKAERDPPSRAYEPP